jgi:plasmid stabilization system protein ParE
MTARWTAKACHRLQQLYDHIAEDQPENAQRFVDRLTRRADALAEHPLTGRVVGALST